MADIVQMFIELLRINCNVVTCYYDSQIEAMFNLFFFPTVFILVVIYLLLKYVLDELKGGLRLLVAITLYAVIVLNGLMTYFIPLSKFWWLVLILVFGGWVFFTRLLFKDKSGGGGGKGGMIGGVVGGAAAGFLSSKLIERTTNSKKKMEEAIEFEINGIKRELQAAKSPKFGAMPGYDLRGTILARERRATELIAEYRQGGIAGGVLDVEKRADKYLTLLRKTIADNT